MKQSIYYIISAVVIFVVSSCKEIYHPETDPMEDVISVDGLVTDRPGMSAIKLNHQSKEDSCMVSLGNATVYVTDNEGNIFPFTDNDPMKPGHYFPSSPFTGVTGRSYTLHIETPGNEVYESEPQTIVSAAKLEELIPVNVIKDFMLKDHSGRYYRQKIPGLEVYADMRGKDEDILRFRIEPTLLLLYNYYEFIGPDVNVYYRWKKIRLTDTEEINLHRFEEGFSRVMHNLCFLPGNKTHYQLSNEEHIYKKILIIRYYTMNNEAYRFHAEVFKQINSDNKLFDPIVSQLPSNIRCTSHPGKPAAGFFEASSTRTETYMLIERLQDDILEFSKIMNLDNVSLRGSLKNEKPWFW
ncbi:MAG: DUF4249 family protein [Bacteroidales bacterium]